MTRLMILADDLTGAVDTGAFPVACGREVVVYTDPAAYDGGMQRELVCINMATRGCSEKMWMLRWVIWILIQLRAVICWNL